MNLQRGTPLRDLLANLQITAGSLLLLGTVAHALLAGFTIPELDSSALWASSGQMFPIAGGSVPVPEIDPGSAGSGIALLIGGLLLLSGLRSKREARSE